MGFNIGSVFLLLRADAARLEADIEQQGMAAADKAGQKVGQTLGEQMSTGLLKAGKQMQSVGMSLTRNVTVPIVGLGAAVVATGAQFDTTLRQIVALTNTTADEIGGVKDQILGLAEATGKDPNELAKGFYFLASAGFDTAQAMKVLESTAKASAAGLGDTADISRVVGAAINAFGKENLTAADATDQLLRAVKNGTAEAPDFAASLGQVVGTAGQMGATFADTTSAIAAMTLKGIDADTAATSLNQVFVSLLKTTPASAKALADVGLSAEGLRAELRQKGLLAVLDTLRTSFEGNDTAAAAVFGNVRALRGVLALTTGDAKQTADVFNDVASGSQNIAQAFAQTEGPGRELDRAVTEIKVALIQLGDDVLPSVVEGLHIIVGIIHGAVGVFKALPGPVRSGTVALLALAATVGPVLFAFGKLSSGLGLALRGIGAIAGKLGLEQALTGAFAKLPASAAIRGAITSAGTAMGGALGVAMGVGLAAAGGVAIALAFKSIVLDPGLQAQTRDIGTSVGNEIMGGTTEALQKSKAALAQGIKDISGQAFGLGGALYGDQISALQTQLDAVDAELAARAAGMGHEVPAGVASAFDHGEATVTAGAEKMVSGVDDVLGGVVNDAGDAGAETVQSYAQGVLDTQGAVRSAFDTLKNLIKNALSPAKRIAKDIGILTSKTLAKALNDKRPEVVHAAELVQQQAMDELGQLVKDGGKVGKAGMEALRKALHSKNPEVRAAARRVKELINEQLDKVPPHATHTGTEAGNALVTAMQQAINRRGGVTVRVTATGEAHGGGRAGGGPVRAGTPYWVNEQTPRSELFVPSRGGYVLTHADAVKAASGGGPMTIGPITITGVGSDVSKPAAERFGRAVLGEVAKGLREQRARTV